MKNKTMATRASKSKFVSVSAMALAMLATAGQSYASFTFSDVSITQHSITFTIDGDMSGYAAPAGWQDQFGLQYKGNLWVGPAYGYAANSWSQNPFNNESFSKTGNTGLWDSIWGYSWSWQSASDLSNAYATKRTVTLDFGNDYLNPSAQGTLNFVWGWAHSAGSATVLGSIVTPVPEPSTMIAGALMLLPFGVSALRKIRANRST